MGALHQLPTCSPLQHLVLESWVELWHLMQLQPWWLLHSQAGEQECFTAMQLPVLADMLMEIRSVIVSAVFVVAAILIDNSEGMQAQKCGKCDIAEVQTRTDARACRKGRNFNGGNKMRWQCLFPVAANPHEEFIWQKHQTIKNTDCWAIC